MGHVVGFGEVMLRLATPRGRLLESTASLEVDFGGAEANTLIALSRLGHDATFLSCLPNSDWGRRCEAVLAASGVQTRARYFDGARIGTYFVESGAGLRGSRVLYDRKDSAFARRGWSKVNWPCLLNGVDWLHMSGITLALSKSAARVCEEAARAARATGCRVSFDCNYREALWDDPAQFGAACRRIVACADLVFCGIREIRWMRDQLRTDGVSSDPTQGFGLLKEMAPDMRILAGTLHDQDGTSAPKLGGFITNGDESALLAPRRLGEIVDPLGGGDAFAAGVLHGLLEGWPALRTVEFAIAAASLKRTMMGDQLRATPADVMRHATDGGRVSR